MSIQDPRAEVFTAGLTTATAASVTQIIGTLNAVTSGIKAADALLAARYLSALVAYLVAIGA